MDITVKELKDRLDQGTAPLMIDVREPHEWEMQHLPGVRKIAMGSIPATLDELEPFKEQEVVLICRSGNRSGRVTAYLEQMGFQHARNLAGGMLAWKKEIDPTFEVE